MTNEPFDFADCFLSSDPAGSFLESLGLDEDDLFDSELEYMI